MNNHPEESEHIPNQLFLEKTETDSKRWYATPEACDDPTKLNNIERRIYDKTITLRDKEHLNSTKTDAQRKELLSKFNWKKSLLNEDKKARLEHIVVNYPSIWAGHRLDIGNKREFGV